MQVLNVECGDLSVRPRESAEDGDDRWGLSVGRDTLEPQFRSEVSLHSRSAVAQRDRRLRARAVDLGHRDPEYAEVIQLGSAASKVPLGRCAMIIFTWYQLLRW